MSNKDVFVKIFKDLDDAKTYSPRNLKVKEIVNYNFTIENPYDRIMNFEGRNINLKYIIAELCWYLRGELKLDGIDNYSKFWLNVCGKKGQLNSNYGHYIFKEKQLFNNVIDRLKKDMFSRQAVIIINRLSVIMNNDTKDQICTTSLQFLIRDNKLHMIVNMRSNDLIFGLGNDLPFFTILQELVLEILKKYYPSLYMGNYYHNDGSLHIYERHFQMVKDVIKNDKYDSIAFPKINGYKEAMYIINNLGSIEQKIRQGKDIKCDDEFKFTRQCIMILKT